MTEKRLRKVIQQFLLISYMLKKMSIYPTYISKRNSNHEKQIILLVIPNGGGRHYLAIKILSAKAYL